MKQMTILLLLFPLLLVACGTNSETSDKNANEHNATNVDEMLSFSTSSVKEKDSVRFELALRNETGKDMKIIFPSSQKYEIIVSKDEKIVYQYSIDKMFTQAITEEVIKNSEQVVWEEEWQYDQTLASGEYNVQIQLLLTELNGEKVDTKKYTTTDMVLLEKEEAMDVPKQVDEELPEEMIKNVDVIGDKGAYTIRGEVYGAIGTLFYEVEDGHQYLIDTTELPIEVDNKWTEFDIEISISDDKLPTNGALMLFLYNDDRSVQLPIQLELFQ